MTYPQASSPSYVLSWPSRDDDLAFGTGTMILTGTYQESAASWASYCFVLKIQNKEKMFSKILLMKWSESSSKTKKTLKWQVNQKRNKQGSVWWWSMREIKGLHLMIKRVRERFWKHMAIFFLLYLLNTTNPQIFWVLFSSCLTTQVRERLHAAAMYLTYVSIYGCHIPKENREKY